MYIQSRHKLCFSESAVADFLFLSTRAMGENSCSNPFVSQMLFSGRVKVKFTHEAKSQVTQNF